MPSRGYCIKCVKFEFNYIRKTILIGDGLSANIIYLWYGYNGF